MKVRNNLAKIGNKIEGKIMYIADPNDTEERNDTSFDSINNDQLFLTFVDKEDKQTQNISKINTRIRQDFIDNEIN